MDNSSAEYVQVVGNEADEAMEVCLQNPVIVRTILEHVSSKELLQISLVNKLWRYEARSVLRNRGNLIANLRPKQYPLDMCKAVEAFVSDLPKLGAIPISGISFDNSYEPHYCSYLPDTMLPIHDVNLPDQLSLKSVSLEKVGKWSKMDCPAFLLAKKVVQQFCGDLETLKLYICEGQEIFLEDVFQDWTFPRLSVLHVSVDMVRNEDTENFLRALLARAPNLKMLHTYWNINSVLQLLRGTSVELVYTLPVLAPFVAFSDDEVSSIRLDSVTMLCFRGFDFERLNRIAPILLQASTKTLRTIIVDAVLALSLICYGIPFESVRNFRMEIEYRGLERIDPRILTVVKNIDFTRMFPSLNTVRIACDFRNSVSYLPLGHMNALIEQANAVLGEPMLDRAVRVKELLLNPWFPSSASAQLYFEMFPSIQKLSIDAGRGGYADAYGPIPFGSIWNWSDLKELEVKGNALPTTGNLDSVFCGIFPEEVEELRLKDDEYLKRVNIVPIMPAVTCLRNLRTLSLHHYHHQSNDYFGDATFLFSKVTALVAFARQPALDVSLKISARAVPPSMTHLSSYVSVTSDHVEDGN